MARTRGWRGGALALILALGDGCEAPGIAARDLCAGRPCDGGAAAADRSAADALASDGEVPAADAAARDVDPVDRGTRSDAQPPEAGPGDAVTPPDGSAPRDVSVASDATSDAGSSLDVSVASDATFDAGSSLDVSAGSDATSDAGAPPDVSVATDATASSDAGVSPDASTASDATARSDLGAGPDATPVDAGPARPLSERVAVHTLDLSPRSVATSTSYEYGPFLATLPDGRAKLAWCDSAAGTIQVRHLGTDLATSERADSQVAGIKLFGLVAHADGRAALLAVRAAPGACTPCTASESCVSCNELYLVQLGADGSVLQSARVDDRLAHTGQFSGGALALGSHAGVEAYAVARTVRGAGPDSGASAFCVSSARNSGHQWHETWLYRSSDLGLLTSGCNVFPCGHSLVKRSVTWHPDSGRFGSVCMSDYSGTRTGFNYAENSGWNHRLYNVWRDWPDFVNGGHPSELVVASSSSYLVALTAPASCQSDCAAEDHDLALFEVAHATLSPVGGPRWLRTTSAAQNYPHLARHGAGFLLGWVEGSARYLLELDPGGQALGEPVDLAGLASFDYGSPWQTLAPAGDVVWPRRAGTSSIEIVRVAR